MNSKDIEKLHKSIFEEYRRINEFGEEYWSARDFYKILEYADWRKFINVINKAKESCNNSGYKEIDHFLRAEKLVEIGYETQNGYLRKFL